MADKQLRVVIVGDAKSVQKAFADTGTAATQAEVKVEGFGKSFASQFAKIGGAAQLGARAADLLINSAQAGARAILDYSVSVDQSEKLILGFTKSQEKVAAATALARKEADAGRSTYQETLSSLAALTPLANKYGLSLEEVLHTTQLLAASDPVQGFEGAKIAIQEALSGDFTSLARRFELPKNAIQELKDQGVPNLQIVQRVLKDLGIDEQFLATANTSAAKQFDLLKGELIQIGAEITKGLFTDLADSVKSTSDQLKDAESNLRKLGEGFKFVEDKLNGLNVNAGKAGVNLGRSIFEGLKSIAPSGDNPVSKWLDEQIARYDEDGRKAAAAAADAAKKTAEAFVKAGEPTPTQKATVQGYGTELLDEFLKGLTSGQIKDFDNFSEQFKKLFSSGDSTADANAFIQAQSLLAQALKEVAQDGQISETTLFRLTTTFGKSAAEVERLTLEYGRMGAAQDKATASTEGLKQAQQGLANVQNQAKNDLRGYQEAIDSATKTAADNAAAAADAIAQEQDALSDLGKEAAVVARQNQTAIDGLQASAAAHAEANQQAIANAQTALSAATEQRKRDADIAQAAINGTTEAYERQTEGLTEQDRKLAEHYETIIGGERRALDAANERIDQMDKEAHVEDLALLKQIKAAQEAGRTGEANHLKDQLAKKRQARSLDREIANAEADVAKDNFDAKAKQIDKEAAKKDEADTTAEKTAGKRLAEVQTQADAQAKADAAAIKGAQDAAAADSERYRKQQEGIQDEIDKLGDAQKAQAAKDKQAITDAQTLKTQRDIYWADEEAGATVALGFAQKIAAANERTATAAKETYDADVARAPIAKQAADDAEREAKARQEGRTIVGVRGGTQGDDNGQNDGAPLPAPVYAPPTAPVTPQTPGAPNLPPLKDGNVSPYPPAGYYEVLDSNHHRWYVPYGYRLSDYGIQEAAQSGSSNGGSDSLSRGGQSALRESGATAAGAGVGAIHLHINAPGLTDVGSPAQQRALAAQVGDAALRAWTDVQRGGPPQGVV